MRKRERHTQRSASAAAMFAVDENYRFQNYSVIIAQVHRTYEPTTCNHSSTNDPSVCIQSQYSGRQKPEILLIVVHFSNFICRKCCGLIDRSIVNIQNICLP